MRHDLFTHIQGFLLKTLTALRYGVVQAHHSIAVCRVKCLDKSLFIVIKQLSYISDRIYLWKKSVRNVWGLQEQLKVRHSTFLHTFVIFSDKYEDTIDIRGEQ